MNDSGSLWSNVLLLLIVAGALAVALSSGNKASKPAGK
jgi:hypothetical protein